MALLPNKQWREVLGMNARTLEYIKRVNSAKASRIANRKLSTKRVLQQAGIATPRTFGIIHNRSELKRFRWTKLPASFVLKPNSTSGGIGIMVIFGRNKKGNWVKADRSEIFIPELRNHTVNILDGNFSHANIPDVAFFEQRVKIHSTLKPYCVKGVPDIRILVYNFIPVMAMLRLPTEESSGRANLHAGGIGVGIDLSLGFTTTSVQHSRPVEMLPNRLKLSGIALPNWNEVLELAVRAAQAIGLNYAGVDIAIDRDDGPVVLEINARPGLDIQFANMTPLKSRLKRVEGLRISSPAKSVRLAKSLFGVDVEEIEDMTGRTLLGIEEKVTVYDHAGEPHSIIAKVDTGAHRTTIDINRAKQIGIHQPVIEYDDVWGALGEARRPVIEMDLQIRDRRQKSKAFLADRSNMRYEMILGRRDLKGFLVDPTKRLPKPS